jgi:hypothetical protein
MTRAVAAWVIAIACAAAGSARADDKTIVVPAEAATAKVDAAVLAATARGVKQAARGATVADASLADSAFILGCDPATDRCRDEVAGQLGYQRLVIVARKDAQVEVVVRQRGGASQRRTFVVTGEGDQAGLAAVERDVATMLGAGRGDAGGNAGGGGGDTGGGGGGTSGGGATDGGGVVGVGGSGAATAGGARGRGVPRGALIVGIGGGALVLGGAVLWGLAAAKQGDIDDAPTATVADLEHLAALESDGRSYASIGNGLVIGGGLAVAAAGVWILVTRNRERSSVQIAPAVAPGAATLRLEASW